MSPFLSIIIPAFNASKFISNCLNSILCQEFNDYEIIVVNDGSSDNTLEICKSFCTKNNRIKVINQSNRGVSHARNVGLSIAEGKYIWFIDADDEVAEISIADIVEQVKELSYPDIIRSEYRAIDENNNSLFYSKPEIKTHSKIIKLAPEKFYKKCVRQEFFLWLLWIKREIIKDSRFVDGRIYMEDADFICNLMPQINTTAYTSSSIYKYRKYTGAVSSELNFNKYNDIQLFLYNLCDISKKYPTQWESYYAKTVCNKIILLLAEYLQKKDASERKNIIARANTDDLLKVLSSTFGLSNTEWGKIEKEGWELYLKRFKVRQLGRTLKRKIKSAISIISI